MPPRNPLAGSALQATVIPSKCSRRSGILLHVTSLPGGVGIGDLGKAAYDFADFLAESGQKIWQVLPLGPTGYGDSPYQLFSAFAGNPLLIDLEELRQEGLLSAQEMAQAPVLPESSVEYGRVIEVKQAFIVRAASRFFGEGAGAVQSGYEGFCRSNADWLDDYALFMACKEHYGDVAWAEWDVGLRKREGGILESWKARLAGQIRVHKFAQFKFFEQWQRLKGYCHGVGIQIMGDVPIYVAHDSADVWAHPELFRLDEECRPVAVAGVPPDYFSATGQLWGNPLYRWDVSRASGHRWWIERFRASLGLFDMVRLDHFRGFEAFWEIPAGALTAQEGKWVNGPGAELFQAVQNELKELPFVAENLGVITPEVEGLRRQFGFPGMSLLQFAFGNDPQGPSFRPHNYCRELVAYTGGHDNDTTLGWWMSGAGGDSTRTPADIDQERSFTREYLAFGEEGCEREEAVNWVFIRAVMASVAETAIAPLQDVLGLGSEARMNLPGTVSGNWRWRYRSGDLTQQVSRKLQRMTRLYGR